MEIVVLPVDSKTLDMYGKVNGLPIHLYLLSVLIRVCEGKREEAEGAGGQGGLPGPGNRVGERVVARQCVGCVRVLVHGCS